MKSLVLLDIDGVINDLNSLVGRPVAQQYDVNVVESNGYDVHIPAFMPGLIQRLVDNCEVHWLSTWRERANDEIAEALGIDPLPVVTDGGDARNVRWKPAAAYDVAEAALGEGREVWWIEDFYNDIPANYMPEGVQFVDTATRAVYPVLMPEMVPSHLLSSPVPEPLGRFGEPMVTRGNVFSGGDPELRE